MGRYYEPEYGDNIYDLGGRVAATLRASGWSRDKIDAILSDISSAPSYDAAIAICAQYITIAARP